jgi:hypothetical protein
MKKLALVALAIVSILAVPAFVLAQSSTDTAGTAGQSQQALKVNMPGKSQVVQEVSTLGNDEMMGRIDWENKIIYAVGDGVPPKDAVNPAQARARAKRAAIDEAYARLLETVQEVQVDATSTTRNFVNENRVVQTKVSGLIKNAEVQELKQASDGSFQIMMKMPMLGEKGLSSAILPVQLANVRQVSIVAHKKQEAPPAAMSPQTKATPNPSPANAATANVVPIQKTVEAAEKSVVETAGTDRSVSVITGKHTSLIVDAKGLGAKPALYPAIETESGEMIYDVTMADPNATVEDGLCTYKKSIDEAKKMPKVGNSPLVVKAAKVGGKHGVNIVISDQDGKWIIEANKVNPFLKRANVNLVID